MSGQRVIVVGVDRSARSRVAANWAAREASRRGLPLRVVEVAQPEPLALCQDAEIVVLALPGEDGLSGPVPGSTAREVAGWSTCPVVLVPGGLVRAGPTYRPTRITVGVDARDPAAGAIDFAFDTARRWRARLRVLHAWALPPSAAEFPFSVPEEDRATWEDHEVQLLSDAVRPWHEKYPTVRILEDVVLFSPAEALIRNPGSSELVVIGRRHSSTNGSGLPATADELLRRTRCPVAVVPG